MQMAYVHEKLFVDKQKKSFYILLRKCRCSRGRRPRP